MKEQISSQNKENMTPRRCQYCGSEAPLVWVHGHGQCAACGINVQECCQGEQCKEKVTPREG